MCVAPRRGGVGSCVRVPPTGEIGTSTPAPAELVCPSLAFDCAFSSPRRGRSPFKVCPSAVDVCFAFPTDFPRDRGRRGRLTPPKTERGAFRLSKLAEKLPRSVFRLRRASPPPLGHCPSGARRGASPAKVEDRFELWLRRHRAQSTAFSAGTAPRAAYASLRLFSRPVRTKLGRSVDNLRGPRESFARPLGARRDDDSRSCGRRARRGRLLVARRVDRAIRVFSVDRVGKHL